jgi:hypothetical protein
VDGGAAYSGQGVRTALADEVLVYVSAGPDVQWEQEMLCRAVTPGSTKCRIDTRLRSELEG